MPITVNVPGKGRVSFPDTMSQEEIRVAIQKMVGAAPPPPVAAPVAAKPTVVSTAKPAAPSVGLTDILKTNPALQAIGALFSPVGPVRRGSERLANRIEGVDRPAETNVPLAEMARGVAEEVKANPALGTLKGILDLGKIVTGISGYQGLYEELKQGLIPSIVREPGAAARGFAGGIVRSGGALSPAEMVAMAAGGKAVVKKLGGRTTTVRRPVAGAASAELSGLKDLPDTAEPQSGVRRPLPRRSLVESALDKYRQRGAPAATPPRDITTTPVEDLIDELGRIEPVIRANIEGKPTDLAPRLVKPGGEQVSARPSTAERYIRQATEEPLNVQAAIRRRSMEKRQGRLVPAGGRVDLRQIIDEALGESRAGDPLTSVELPPSEPAPMPRTGSRGAGHPGQAIPDPAGGLGHDVDSAAAARQSITRIGALRAQRAREIDRLAMQQVKEAHKRAVKGIRDPKIPLPFREGESTLASLPKNASPEEVRAFIQEATAEAQAAPGTKTLPPLRPAGTVPTSSAVEAFNLKGKLFRRIKNLTTGDSKLDKDLTRFKWLAQQEKLTADQLIEMGKTERNILANPALPKGIKSQWERTNERAARPTAGTTTRVAETAPAERATSGEIPSATAAARAYSGPERRGPGPQGKIDPHGGDPNVGYTAESLALEDAKMVASVISGRKPATILIPSSDPEFGAGTPALLKKAREAGKVVHEDPEGVTIVARDQKSLDTLLKAFKRAEAGDDAAHADIGRAFGYRQADINVFYRNQGREAPPLPAAPAPRMVRVTHDENGIRIPVNEQPIVPMPVEVASGAAATIAKSMDDAVAAAKARIASRGTFKGVKLSPGLPLDDLADMAIIGGAKIAKGAVQFAQWSAEMVQEFGEAVRPHLQAIFNKAKPQAAAYALPALPKIKKVVINGKETWQKIGVSERSEAAAERIRPKASIPPPEPPPPEIAAPARAEVIGQSVRVNLSDMLQQVEAFLPKIKGVTGADLAAVKLLTGEVGKPLTPAGEVFVKALEDFANSPIPKQTTVPGGAGRPPLSTRITKHRTVHQAGAGKWAGVRRVVPEGWGWPESVHRQTEARRPLENRKAAARLSAFIRRNVEVDAAKPRPDVTTAVRSPESLSDVAVAPKEDFRRSGSETAFNAPKLTVQEQKARAKLAARQAARPIEPEPVAPAVPPPVAVKSVAPTVAAKPVTPVAPEPLIEAFVKNEIKWQEAQAPRGVEPDTWSFIRSAEKEAVRLIEEHGVRDPRLIDPLRRFWGSQKTADMLGIPKSEVEAISGSPHGRRPLKALLDEADARYNFLVNDPRGFLRVEAMLAGTGAAAGGLVGATIEGEDAADRVAYMISGALLGGGVGWGAGKGLEAAISAAKAHSRAAGKGKSGSTIPDHIEALDTAQMLAGPAAIKASLGSINATATGALQRLREGRWSDGQRGLRYLQQEGVRDYMRAFTTPTAQLAQMNQSVLNIAQKVNAGTWSGRILTNVLRPFMAADTVAEKTLGKMGFSKAETERLLLMGEPTSWRAQNWMGIINSHFLFRMGAKFSRIRLVSLERAMEMTPFLPERFVPRSTHADVPSWYKGFKQAEPLKGKALRARRQIGGATLIAGTVYGYYRDPGLAEMSLVGSAGGPASLLASVGMAAGKGIRRGKVGLLEALGEVAASVPGISESTIRTFPDRLRVLGPLRRAIASVTGEDPWDTIRGK